MAENNMVLYVECDVSQHLSGDVVFTVFLTLLFRLLCLYFLTFVFCRFSKTAMKGHVRSNFFSEGKRRWNACTQKCHMKEIITFSLMHALHHICLISHNQAFILFLSVNRVSSTLSRLWSWGVYDAVTTKT